ncbi:MAG: LytTR family transcriptional regulator [Defluviitaleaceae bacterium]|nr:LytTR family transcriptional regulator [Defluviitaleaceae bacterium]
MLDLYLHSYEKTALNRLKQMCSNCFELDWQTRIETETQDLAFLLKSVKQTELPALFILEELSEQAPKAINTAVSRIRQDNALHYLLLQVGTVQQAVQPRPAYFRANGFLLQPLQIETLRQHLTFIYEDFNEVNNQYGGFLSFKMSGTVYKVAYDKILFFEAKGKKVMARTRTQEFEFYASLEKIGTTAPKYFLQIHRGIYANTTEIKNVNLTDKVITMQDDTIIPFSRTYRDDLIEFVKRQG